MFGFTFRGRHSIRDLGIVFRTVARPVMPPPRIVNETVPYRDGSVDYSTLNGRIYYDDKVLELEISVVGTDLLTLHTKISEVVSWLAGGFGELVFDDMPLTVWDAMPSNLDSIAPELARVGKATVQFRCRPFNRCLINNFGPVLGDEIPLGTDIALGYGDDEFHDVPGGTAFAITILNPGTAPSAPVLTFSETTAQTVSVSCGGKTLTFSGPVDGLTIDCGRFVCLRGSEDVSSQASGDYFEFFPGENTVSITAGQAAVVSIVYTPAYLYGAVGL